MALPCPSYLSHPAGYTDYWDIHMCTTIGFLRLLLGEEGKKHKWRSYWPSFSFLCFLFLFGLHFLTYTTLGGFSYHGRVHREFCLLTFFFYMFSHMGEDAISFLFYSRLDQEFPCVPNLHLGMGVTPIK